MHRCFRASLALAFAGLFLLNTPAGAAEPIVVHVDQATLVRLPERIGTLIVGNPLIADVTVQSGGLLVVTGKGFGTTNLIALDRQGNVLLDRTVLVSGPREAVVVVYRGAERATYSCAPRCEPRITLGDSPDYFTATMTQAGARASEAAGGQAASR